MGQDRPEMSAELRRVFGRPEPQPPSGGASTSTFNPAAIFSSGRNARRQISRRSSSSRTVGRPSSNAPLDRRLAGKSQLKTVVWSVLSFGVMLRARDVPSLPPWGLYDFFPLPVSPFSLGGYMISCTRFGNYIIHGDLVGIIPSF